MDDDVGNREQKSLNAGRNAVVEHFFQLVAVNLQFLDGQTDAVAGIGKQVETARRIDDRTDGGRKRNTGNRHMQHSYKENV